MHKEGGTAAFNPNVLHRLNGNPDADFDLDGFRNRAIWNPAESRTFACRITSGFYAIAVALGKIDITDLKCHYRIFRVDLHRSLDAQSARPSGSTDHPVKLKKGTVTLKMP
jgi:hypothetical protein